MDYLQAENQLKTFSQETGGYSWFPQFAGEMPDVFRNVAAFLRHQYSLSIHLPMAPRTANFIS